MRQKDRDWRSRLVIPEDRDSHSAGKSASVENPRFFKPKNSTGEMIHVELGGHWVNYNCKGRVLSRDDRQFPPENLAAAFEEIDEAVMCEGCFDIQSDLTGHILHGIPAPQGLWFNLFDLYLGGDEVEVVDHVAGSAEGWCCRSCETILIPPSE